jgi:hypothetical protein
MKIRIGIEGGRKPVLAKAKELGAPILVSANSLWRDGKFRSFNSYLSHDVALDSGGFIAMKKYGGYRWSVGEYVNLAKEMKPAWWAQMDFCCEPEIAADRAAVFKRIDQTAEHLNACHDAARKEGVKAPMPVLQGWTPEDYCSGPIYSASYQWPELVGIGSVCRRNVIGKDGILAVVGALHKAVPSFVKFHLFGVKSQALKALVEIFGNRIESIDSMAWNFGCRKDAHRLSVPCSGEMRAEYMGNWYLKQTRQAYNPQLQFVI